MTLHPTTDALFARGAATAALVQLLLACPEGETVTYAEMARATNRDVQGRDRHLLETALKAARRDGRAVFCAVVRVGQQRMRPEEVHLDGARRLKRISGAARRGGQVLDTVAPERLTPEQRVAHAATRGVLASIEASGKAGSASHPSGRANRDPQVRVA